MAERVLRVLALLGTLAVMVSVVAADARPLPDQPGPDAQEYADGARQIASGEGHVVSIYGDALQPSRYPPGYSLALAPFAWVGEFPGNVQRAARGWVLVYVAVVVGVAWLLGGALAACLAALLVGISPFARVYGGLVLSDAFVAMLTVAILPLLRPLRSSGARLGAALAGLATLVRLTAIVNVVALLAAVPRRLWLTTALFAAPGLVILALVQFATFGNPLTTGYSYWGVDDGSFALAFAAESGLRGDGPFIVADELEGALFEWACPCPAGGPQAQLPNAVFYPAVLLGLFWIFAPPLATLPGIVYAWRRRREPLGRYALAVTALTLVIFVFYFYQGARFMAAPASVLLVLSCVAAAGWLQARATALAARRGGPRPAVAR